MNRLTLSGPAYPTHDSPFPNGWYITDTFGVGFLSDTHDALDHLVGRTSKRVERVIDSTNPDGKKSLTSSPREARGFLRE